MRCNVRNADRVQGWATGSAVVRADGIGRGRIGRRVEDDDLRRHLSRHIA